MTRRRLVKLYLGNLFCFQEFSFCSIEVKTEKNTLNSDFYSNCNSYETLIITIRVHLAPEMAFEAFHSRHGRVSHMRSFNHKQKRWDTD